MRLVNLQILLKYLKKNRGNKFLKKEIEKLVFQITNGNWNEKTDLLSTRPDADCVHKDGFYIFDISAHRTMIMLEFSDNEATIIWCGNHKDYENTFKNNKSTIKKWLRDRSWI